MWNWFVKTESFGPNDYYSIKVLSIISPKDQFATRNRCFASFYNLFSVDQASGRFYNSNSPWSIDHDRSSQRDGIYRWIKRTVNDLAHMGSTTFQICIIRNMSPTSMLPTSMPTKSSSPTKKRDFSMQMNLFKNWYSDHTRKSLSGGYDVS